MRQLPEKGEKIRSVNFQPQKGWFFYSSVFWYNKSNDKFS